MRFVQYSTLNSEDNSYVIYGGKNGLKTSNGELFSWLNISGITDKINV